MKNKFTFLYIVLSICININTATYAQAVNVQDSLALVDLYNSTNGSHWYRHNNWLTGPISIWYGITITGDRIASISLFLNDLIGNIPSSIGNLISLQTLDLSGNMLRGNIPPELGNLVNLQALDLSGNQLSGEIPPDLGNLIDLKYLRLSTNQLSGHIPSELNNLVNLQDLGLASNWLRGSIPPELGNLVNLQTLGLSYNQLSGTIPSSLGNLVNLTTLFLNNDQLSGNIPSSFGNLVNLLNLNLSFNQLSGNIPSSLSDLVNLSFLLSNNNQLSGSIPSSFGNLTNLYNLNLDYNRLSDSIPSSLGNIVTLQELHLKGNQLSGSIPRELGNLAKLRVLDISGNRFTFAGMELIAKKFRFSNYSPQADIIAHQHGNTLTVSAGGTLSNNIYKWLKVGSSDTTIIGDSIFHPSASGNYYAEVTNSICTQLTLHTNTVFYDGTLPVTILNLKSYQAGKVNKVEWTSVTEINVEKYEVQRSSDAHDFITIASTIAKGNGTQRTDYSLNDLIPLIEKNYYRLKIFDKDGKTAYSNTVLANRSDDKTVILIYPNPANNIIHIETKSNSQFSMLNQAGKIVLTANINGKGSINILSIGAGLYYLKNNSSSTVQKVIIAR